MPYNELTLSYFEAPPNVGVIDDAHASRGAAGSRERGTWVQFDVQRAGAAIKCVRFLAFGCPHVIAVAAWVARHSEGRAASGELPATVHRLQALFDVPTEKLGRLLIIEDAWHAANQSGITKS